LLLLAVLAVVVSPEGGARRVFADGPGRQVAPVVIGVDERERITDTASFPFSVVAYLELEDADGTVFASCTGTFIGPDALLTAGHCLWDDEIGNWGAEYIRVIPGKDGDFEPFGWQYAEDWWVPDQYALTGLSEWDWGVIKLPDDSLSNQTGWLSVTVAPTEALEDPAFYPAIVGYPGDKPEGTMWGLIREAFVAVDEFTLYYDIDTAAGQSGSAIWSASDGPYLGLIVGIHTQGGELNNGSRIDDELLADLLTACEAMACSIDVVDAPGTVVTPPPSFLPYRSYGVAVARD